MAIFIDSHMALSWDIYPLIYYEHVFLYHIVCPTVLTSELSSGLVSTDCILFYKMNTFSLSFLSWIQWVCILGRVNLGIWLSLSLINAHIAVLAWIGQRKLKILFHCAVFRCAACVSSYAHIVQVPIRYIGRIYTQDLNYFFIGSPLSFFNSPGCPTSHLFAICQKLWFSVVSLHHLWSSLSGQSPIWSIPRRHLLPCFDSSPKCLALLQTPETSGGSFKAFYPEFTAVICVINTLKSFSSVLEMKPGI